MSVHSESAHATQAALPVLLTAESLLAAQGEAMQASRRGTAPGKPVRQARSNARPVAGGVLERQLDMLKIIPRAPIWITTAQVDQRLQAMGYHVDRRTVVRDLNKLAQRFGIERRGEGGSNAVTVREQAEENAIENVAAEKAPPNAPRPPTPGAGRKIPPASVHRCSRKRKRSRW